MAARVEVTEFIDSRSVGGFQYIVALLCGITVFFDGYDTQSIAFVAPSIARELHLSNATLGPLFSVGLVGLLIGQLALSPLADHIGRRVLIVASTCRDPRLTAAGLANGPVRAVSGGHHSLCHRHPAYRGHRDRHNLSAAALRADLRRGILHRRWAERDQRAGRRSSTLPRCAPRARVGPSASDASAEFSGH